MTEARMTCSECQLQIFGREPGEFDLDRSAIAHLTECEECRELDREVRLNAAALAGMREVPTPVLQVSGDRLLAPGRWALVAALAAAAALVVAIALRPAKIPEHVPIPIAGSPSAAAVLPVARPAPKRVLARRTTPRRPVAKPMPEAPPAEKPLLVKFITDDPDVVVYFIVDPNQGEPGL